MNARREPLTAFDRYNSIAGFRGWLPIGIGEHSTPRTIRDAAMAVEWLNLDVAVELRRIAQEKAGGLCPVCGRNNYVGLITACQSALIALEHPASTTWRETALVDLRAALASK